MSSRNRTYLVDTQNLNFDERAKLRELLDAHCWMITQLAKKPHIFMVHTAYSADEFSAIPLPVGCTVTDVTGQDLMAYY